MKMIPLSQGKFSAVDDEDYDWLMRWKWYAAKPDPKKDKWYARRMDHGSKKLIYMHRVITNCPKGMEPDHINHNTLDNQRHNLRVGTHYDNMQNPNPKQAFSFGKTSKGYRGVRLFEGKWWRAQISINQKPVHLGTFKTAEEAARAYDKANKEYRGNRAHLNFPD